MNLHKTIWLALFLSCAAFMAAAQSNATVRVMAANLNGNTQSYQPFALRIFQGLKPDVVCIQEFNYSNNTPANFRDLVDQAFGPEFSYYREASSYQIPNGIISRYPILASGSWGDAQQSQPNRGFAWARIDLPGTNDLYAVSVHLLTRDASTRAAEAAALKSFILANFPANAWVVIAGDFNTGTRSESAISTLASLCADSPVPTDAVSGGDSDTNNGRNKPYDYVLVSLSLTNQLTNAVFASRSFPKGLVFDSRVYTPLADVSPVQSADSGLAQHMAVLKDFSIPVSGSDAPVAPVISLQPSSQTVAVGAAATFSVTASGTAPLSYQWRFNGTNLSGAGTNLYVLSNAQMTNGGAYTVVITNIAGAVTSSVATLTVSNTPPVIYTQPASQLLFYGETAAFSVVAGGTAPLAYQWRFNGANLSGATGADYGFNNAQTNDAGNYTVVITNLMGSITSAVAVLTFSNPAPVILAPPVSLAVVQGSPAAFAVEAGGAPPLEYQWRFNGTNISGAITNPFALAAAQAGDAGNYSVLVANDSGSVTSAVAVLTVTNPSTAVFTGTLAGWDVNGQTGYGPTPMPPTTNAANLTIVGLTRGPGVTTSGTPAGRAWGGDGFTATSAVAAVTANDFVTCALKANAGCQISFTTISRFDYRRANTGATNGVIQYQVGSGAFVDIASVTYAAGSSGASLGVINLSGIAALQNVGAGTNVTFRIVNYNGAAAGNWYIFDVASNTAPDFSIDGTVAPIISPPAVAPVLGPASLSGGQLQFSVSGTTGSNYIVQFATDLSAANWTPLLTNPAPFVFAETNLAAPQRFYRVVAP